MVIVCANSLLQNVVTRIANAILHGNISRQNTHDTAHAALSDIIFRRSNIFATLDRGCNLDFRNDTRRAPISIDRTFVLAIGYGGRYGAAFLRPHNAAEITGLIVCSARAGVCDRSFIQRRIDAARGIRSSDDAADMPLGAYIFASDRRHRSIVNDRPSRGASGCVGGSDRRGSGELPYDTARTRIPANGAFRRVGRATVRTRSNRTAGTARDAAHVVSSRNVRRVRTVRDRAL